MFRSRDILEREQLLTLYNSLFLPHLNYCNMIWAINFETHLKHLFLLQKREARIILGLLYTESATKIFKEIGIKPISVLRDLKCMILVYKVKHRLLPSQVCNLLEWKIFDPNRTQLRNAGPLITLCNS